MNEQGRQKDDGQKCELEVAAAQIEHRPKDFKAGEAGIPVD